MKDNTWVEIDLNILARNIRNLRAALNKESQIIFVVKADAYHHGMGIVAQHAWKCGVRWFAVVHMAEALALREMLPEAEIVLLGVIRADEAVSAAGKRLIPLVVSERHARSLSAAVKEAGKIPPLRCHAKIDTGMGRLGFLWEEAGDMVAQIASFPGLKVEGLCTHMASADESGGDSPELQIERFRRVLKQCERRGMKDLFKHVSNSGGILRSPDWDMDGVRPGILLYGYGTADPCRRPIETRPFLQWKTSVLQVKKVPAGFPVSYGSTYQTDRETTLAVINAGYSDGYSRLLGNRGAVLIRGRRMPIVGRVTMNLIIVDVGPSEDVREGDEAVLLGKQGNEAIWADEIAALRQTIPYEVLVNIQTECFRPRSS